ncbi:MAG: hypothetical protein AB1505_33415 [Candidatus Latescibacterota bacterium]
MATLSGLWLPVFGSTQGNPTSYGSWDSTHQTRYTGTGANRLINTPWQSSSPSLEDDILTWINNGSGRPTLGVHNRKWNNLRLWDLAGPNAGGSQSYVETHTKDILDDYAAAGFMDAIWGFEVNHEQYGASGTSWNELGWVVGKIAAERPGKAILAIGDPLHDPPYNNTFYQKLWSSQYGLFVAERYVWQPSASILWSVTQQQARWREMADKAASISTGNTNQWMGIVACHREIHSGSDYYRYPDEQELLYTALGPIAHGGQGTLFFLFEGGWSDANTQYLGVYENATQRSYVQNAISRMNAVSNLLTYFTYQAYALSTELPSGWNLDSISSGDTSNQLNILEVCHWLGPDGESLYVLCNRDPDASKNVTTTFNGTYSIYLNGEYKTTGSSYQFSIPAGDVAVVKVE